MRVNILLAGMLCVLLHWPAFADDDVSKLKKLFTDQQQRAHIDAIRSGKKHGTGSGKAGKVELKGYVTRTDGKSVAWINEKNTLEKTRVDDIRVNQANIGIDKKVGLNIDGRRIRLKPGETWYVNKGKIVDNR